MERTVGYLETSFLPLRHPRDIAGLKEQHDAWAQDVAFRRHHRRVGTRVADAYGVEKPHLGLLPDPLPDTDRHLETRISKDAFIRAAGADYSVPPGLVDRRVHVRALRAAREAEHSLRRGDIPLEIPDLARYDALLGVTL